MQQKKDSPWYVLNVKPKQESVAEKNLRKLGVEVYLPLYYKTIKKHKEKTEVVSPLFTGYIFARFDLTEFYHKVIYTRGVKSVLGNSTALWTLGNDRIEQIKERELGGVIRLQRKTESFKKGDRVIVDEGSFDGWEGVFQEELPDEDRVIILLTSIGFSSKMTVPKNILVRKT